MVAAYASVLSWVAESDQRNDAGGTRQSCSLLVLLSVDGEIHRLPRAAVATGASEWQAVLGLARGRADRDQYFWLAKIWIIYIYIYTGFSTNLSRILCPS